MEDETHMWVHPIHQVSTIGAIKPMSGGAVYDPRQFDKKAECPGKV